MLIAQSALTSCWWRAPLLTAVLGGVGCGPSFEAIQEGDLRFAHCDRLDLDEKITASHRLHCWREWQRVYSFGQTRDRVEYAQRRIAVISSGDLVAPVRLTPQIARGRRALTQASKAALDKPAQTSGPAACQAECAGALEKCQEQCVTHPHGCERCEPEKNACMDRCG